jgi:hypothetical protein
VSIPNEQVRSTGEPSTSAGRLTADGKRVFRMTPPLVIWWGWVAVILICLGDLLIQGHQFISLKLTFAALALTGLVFACTFWPRVTADDVGIKVRNPFRVFGVPWGAVRGIYLADSVEVLCARPAPKKNKTIYSWALSSPRRARARAQLRAWQWDQGKRSRPSGYSKLPQPAQTLVKMTTAEIMARELAALADEARFRSVVHDVDIDVAAIRLDDGVPGADVDADADAGAGSVSASSAAPAAEGAVADGSGADGAGADGAGLEAPAAGPDGTGVPQVVSSGWAWQPLLAIVAPAIGFVLCLLIK